MNRRWCPTCERMRSVEETHEEGTTERHPDRIIVTELDCGHSTSVLAADQSERI